MVFHRPIFRIYKWKRTSTVQLREIRDIRFFVLTHFMNSGDLAITFSNSAKDKKPSSSRSASSNNFTKWKKKKKKKKKRYSRKNSHKLIVKCLQSLGDMDEYHCTESVACSLT